MEVFDIIYPSPLLTPYIKYYWALKADGITPISERVISTGCINLIFHKGSRMYSSANEGLQPQSFVGGLTIDYTDLTSTGSIDMLAVIRSQCFP